MRTTCGTILAAAIVVCAAIAADGQSGAVALSALREQLADAIIGSHPIKVADCGIITMKGNMLSRSTIVFREDVHSRGDKAGSRKGRKTP